MSMFVVQLVLLRNMKLYCYINRGIVTFIKGERNKGEMAVALVECVFYLFIVLYCYVVT